MVPRTEWHNTQAGETWPTARWRATTAIAELRALREKFGWAQPLAQVPPTEQELLRAARRSCRKDVVVLEDWQEAGHISAAARLRDLEGIPFAVVLSGPSDIMTGGTIQLRPLEIRRMLREALSGR